MNFDSYIVSETKTAFSIPLSSFYTHKYKNPNREKSHKKAFTLAETLITLSIIGVIAAVTVPTLMTNVNKNIYVSGLKKTYSNLQNALKMIAANANCGEDLECAGFIFDKDTFMSSENNDIALKMIAEQFKNSKIEDRCEGLNDKCLRTEDGTTIATGVNWGSYIELKVDINGPKGPNKDGRDAFSFWIATQDRNGIKQGTLIPTGSQLHAQYENMPSIYYKNSKYQYSECGASYCTGKVLAENAMNY